MRVNMMILTVHVFSGNIVQLLFQEENTTAVKPEMQPIIGYFHVMIKHCWAEVCLVWMSCERWSKSFEVNLFKWKVDIWAYLLFRHNHHLCQCRVCSISEFLNAGKTTLLTAHSCTIWAHTWVHHQSKVFIHRDVSSDLESGGNHLVPDEENVVDVVHSSITACPTCHLSAVASLYYCIKLLCLLFTE